MKNFIDDKFLNNKWKFILQCFIVTCFLSLILIFLDFVLKLSVVASLGATSFIIFTIPHKNASRVPYILGGYTVGVIVGIICTLGSHITMNIPLTIWGAIAIGLSMFLMVILNFEHPPAAALSLGLVMEGFDIKTVITVFTISISLLVIRWLLRKWLIDLL